MFRQWQISDHNFRLYKIVISVVNSSTIIPEEYSNYIELTILAYNTFVAGYMVFKTSNRSGTHANYLMHKKDVAFKKPR